jgi:hypothetical protein
MSAVVTTTCPELELIARGKVRDLYRVDAASLLFVATDRISAFDVIMNNVWRRIPFFFLSESSELKTDQRLGVRVEDEQVEVGVEAAAGQGSVGLVLGDLGTEDKRKRAIHHAL